MKKAWIVLLILSLIANIVLGVMLGLFYHESQNREQENANQILFAIQEFSSMNDIVQKAVKTGSIERYELSSLQHQVIYIQAAFDEAQHLFASDINNENYHILLSYLAALEDIIYKIENTNPLDADILTALTNPDSVVGGQYKYTVEEYMQLTATKTDDIISRLHIQEQPATDGEGIITTYPRMSEIKKAFIRLME